MAGSSLGGKDERRARNINLGAHIIVCSRTPQDTPDQRRGGSLLKGRLLGMLRGGGFEDDVDDQHAGLGTFDFNTIMSIEKDQEKYNWGLFEEAGMEDESSSNSDSNAPPKPRPPRLEPPSGVRPVSDIDPVVKNEKPWRSRKTGPYANLPDEDTEIHWRLADMMMHEQGEGHRMRHQ